MTIGFSRLNCWPGEPSNENIGTIVLNRETNSMNIKTEDGWKVMTTIWENVGTYKIKKYCDGCDAPVINNHCKYCGENCGEIR